MEDWLLRTCELIRDYQPELLYFDWWIQHEAFKEVLKQVTAYYYNSGVKWGKKVAICYKHDALPFGTGIVEVERGGFKDAKPFSWQTDTAVARNSWCYTTSLQYKSVSEILVDLIDTVSKNGNLLLNIGPKADGTIPEQDQEILKEIGIWLKINGEGIYGGKVWRVSEEGPTKTIEGQFQDQQKKNYTDHDIRYTCKGNSIFAFVLGEIHSIDITLTSLKISEDQNNLLFHGVIDEVNLLGYGKIDYIQNKKGLVLNVPEEYIGSQRPIGFKIKVK